MSDVEFSAHARDMLTERNLLEEWGWRTINSPDDSWKGNDENLHYATAIHERENRILHVVINANVDPHRIVTVFFDRRLRK